MRCRTCLLIATLVVMGCGANNSDDSGNKPPPNGGAIAGTTAAGGMGGTTTVPMSGPDDAVSALSVRPSALDFGAVAVGERSALLQITAVGIGVADVRGIPTIIGSVSFGIFGGPSCTSSTMCVWQIYFEPLYAGAFSATLIVGNGSNGTVLLTGTGVASGSISGAGGIEGIDGATGSDGASGTGGVGGAGGSTGEGGTTGAALELAINQAELDFGAVAVGAASTIKTVTISSINPFVLRSMTVGPPFEIQNTTCVGSVASCTVSIAFLPVSIGPAIGTLMIEGNAYATLTGSGVAPASFTLSSSALPATLSVGDSIPVSVTVTASGTITDLLCVSSGADLTSNSAETTCMETLSAGSSCEYVYVFNAAKAGVPYDAITCSAGGMVKAVVVEISVLATP